MKNRNKVWILAGVLGVACLATLSSGCVGIGTLHSKRSTIRNPVLYARAEVGEAPLGSTGPLTEVAVLREWGEPDFRLKNLLTYDAGVLWYGVIVCPSVPLPLALPAARERVTFTIEGGVVVSTIVVEQDGSGFLVGLIPSPCGLPELGYTKW